MKRMRFDDRAFVAAAHEDPSDPGVWKKVLFRKDDLQIGRIQMVNWAKLPIGRTFAAHYHEDMQEMFIILTGETRIQVDDDAFVLRRGDAVRIDAREVHQMWNEGDEDVHYLAIGIAGGPDGKTVLVEDTDAPDAGAPDAGAPDAGEPDAGEPDA
jgi:mannose-6-phosphate isomerase-like protein (cupin superfamily)